MVSLQHTISAAVVILNVILTPSIDGFSQFAPTFACDHMTPGHQGTSPQSNEKTTFTIGPMSSSYTPGENIKGELYQ